MNVIKGLIVILVAMGCGAGFAYAEEIRVDFENPAVVNSSFTGLNPSFFFVDPYGGRADSGAATTTWYTRQNYTGKAFDFSPTNASITVSTFFKLSSSEPPAYQYSKSYGEVYLVPSAADLSGSISKAFIRFGIIYPSGGGLSDNIFGGSLPAGGGSFPGFSQNYPVGTFTPGGWYELNVTFTNLGGKIQYDILINEYDASGLQYLRTVVQSTQVTTDAFGLTGDSEVYAGFAFQQNGAEAVDDFYIKASGQSACEGMYSQAELDRAVAVAVAQTEAALGATIEAQRLQIAALQAEIDSLRAEATTASELLATKEAEIATLQQSLQELLAHPRYVKGQESRRDAGHRQVH